VEILTTSITHLPEILIAVMTVLGSQKGYEIYRRKRHSNGGMIGEVVLETITPFLKATRISLRVVSRIKQRN